MSFEQLIPIYMVAAVLIFSSLRLLFKAMDERRLEHRRFLRRQNARWEELTRSLPPVEAENTELYCRAGGPRFQCNPETADRAVFPPSCSMRVLLVGHGSDQT